MAKKLKNQSKKIQNRRAKFDYELGDSFVAGLVLTGAETKSLRMGHGHLRGAYVVLQNGEAYLINATITGSSGIKIPEEEQTRSRKLLLKKREIEELAQAKKAGRSIVPVELLTNGRYLKLRIAVGTGKKKYDKREAIKRRDQERASRVELKDRS